MDGEFWGFRGLRRLRGFRGLGWPSHSIQAGRFSSIGVLLYAGAGDLLVPKTVFALKKNSTQMTQIKQIYADKIWNADEMGKRG